ncbi:hypothetical protein EHQ53_04765 [Leptospira langatensis]|uniref:Lipoprotein n=1 Tax=Leptospira langatensis TaxID=2484983 RepID=A0A5F1ZY95_9LEPT|nr:LIC12048 family lipoprotein [Leptospira langatensis]TGK00132.1 hypothetical protein EHO57_12630 [Leptospira langatensis]TGL42766.1 hypothetical protein EHQ53_04765 [Leptospira langatensis]
MKSSYCRAVILRGLVSLVILPWIASCGVMDWLAGKGGNVDLSRATWLVAEKVPLVVDKGGVPIGSGGTSTPVNNLFNLPPGTKVNVSALGGAIDPTGTTIVNDFDGDGILNINESTTNVWVADYPDIDASVAPPITMKISILKSSTGQSDEITSDINSDDLESTKNQGSESIHQNELNLRTVQFQDQYKTETEASQSHDFEASTSFKYSGGGGEQSSSNSAFSISGSASIKNSNSWSARNLQEATTTKWADKPFKNNIDKDATSVKSDSASTSARKYRSEKTSKVSTTSVVESNAGYVRAALYIKNRSVNMPVKLSNILCTLMFEDAKGNLIPVQSFRLRNDDYSLFQVEVYGGDDFGPYVVELPGLNTAEIESAIASGYNPKIFIVDYTMTHVADSNYKSVLLNFTGDNLKVIEENSKGRTSLVKVYGPNYREKFRVAAFDDLSANDPCTTTTASVLAPGVSLKKALQRISCSGPQVEFADYVADFSEFAPALSNSKIHIKGIKSFAGIPTTLPCTDQTYTSSDGVTRTACVQKPISSWTADEMQNAGVWAIYSNGKFNAPTEYWVDGTNIRIFDPGNVRKAQMVKGVDSIIWAGDNYDIVYISVKDLAKNEVNPPYGATAIGTSGSSPTGGSIDPNDPNSYFKLNTRWDLSQFGQNPYEPDQNSFFVGKVGFDEKVVFTVRLDQTKYLSPDFGTATSGGSYQYFTNFKYTPTIATKRFNIDQVMDFEISLGFGGSRTDWVHVYKDTDLNDPYRVRKMWIDTSGYADQTFRICLRMPTLSQVVDPSNSLVNIYIRPALNSAYRNTIWPLAYTDVKKMRGSLDVPTSIGDTTLYLFGAYGNIEPNDSIYISGDSYPYNVVSSTPTPGAPSGYYTVVVDSAIRTKNSRTTGVTIPSILTAPDARLIVDNSFITDWNTQVNAAPASDPTIPQFLPFLTGGSPSSCSTTNLFNPFGCLGYTPDYRAVNWMGSYNTGVPYWNSWADAGSFSSFLSSGMFQLSTNSGRTYKVGTLNSDYVLSDPGTAVPLSEPVSVTSGDATMVIWRRDTAIYGKVFQVSTGTALSTQFQISTTAITSPNKLLAKLDNGKVAIVWDNGRDIYIAFRNMSTYAAIGTEQKIVTRNYDLGTWSTIGLALGSDRALIAWSDNQYIDVFNTHKLVRGRIFNAATGALSIDTFLISDTMNGDPARYEVSVGGLGGSTAIVARHYVNPNSGNKITNACLYSLTTGTMVGTDQVITSAASASPGFLHVKGASTKGFVVWQSNSNVWYARGIDMATGAKLGTTDLTIDSNITDLEASISGNYLFVTYSLNGGMNLKVLNLADGQFLYTNALPIGSVSAAAVQRPGKTVLSNNTIVSVWEHYENSQRTIRGRTATLSPFALKGSGEFFISTTNQGTQSGVSIAVNDTKSIPIWFAQDTTQQVIRGFNLDLNSPGSLQYGLNNFFLSPLLERDYTLSVQIVP